jgi:hypothetical protein
MTQEELEIGFRVYFDEMQRCRLNKCYWALLHLLVIMPDICGALESADGLANGDLYKDWCRRYLVNDKLLAQEWYEIRCSLLHQGRTLPQKENQPRGRYSRYTFSQPTEKGEKVHRLVSVVNGKSAINLDVDSLMQEVRAGMTAWFRALVSDPALTEARKNVEANIHTVANVAQRGEESVKGFVVRETLPVINLVTASPLQGLS